MAQNQKPTIGCIVVYNTSETDKLIMRSTGDKVRDQLAAIIVGVDEETVNLKVLQDGTGILYLEQISQGNQPEQWDWPVIIKPSIGTVGEESLQNTANEAKPPIPPEPILNSPWQTSIAAETIGTITAGPEAVQETQKVALGNNDEAVIEEGQSQAAASEEDVDAAKINEPAEDEIDNK